MKRLVVCPSCESISGTSIKRWISTGFNVELKRPGGIVLGEIMENGDFLIKRGGQNYTKVTGSDFIVRCGNCGEPVYRKEDYGTNQVGFSWQSWIFRGTFVQEAGTITA